MLWVWGYYWGYREEREKRDTRTMPLANATIRNLKPREQPFKVLAFEGPFRFVKPPRSKLWQFKYRIDGKEKLLSIGIYPQVGLAMARARTEEARALLVAGKDLVEAKKDQQRQERARRGNTFEVLVLEFIAKAAAEWRAASTQTKTEWLLGMANASFGKRAITEITAPMILACWRKVVTKSNHETAKRLRAKIGALVSHAVTLGLAETCPSSHDLEQPC